MRASIFTGCKFISPGQLQWAPTLTSHDPNPPITLETAAAASGIAHPLFGPFAGLLTGKFG